MKKIYLDEYGNDSLVHLKVASENNLDVFVTENKGMLKDKKELEKKFKIKIMTLKEVANEV